VTPAARERLQVALPGDATAPAQARRAARRQLVAWDREGLVDAVVLAVSELVTNAVLHARSQPLLGLVLLEDPVRIRVEVSDGSPTVPRQRRYSGTSATGRGLGLVEALSETWGTERTPTGKLIWAVFGPEGEEPDAAAWLSDTPAL